MTTKSSVKTLWQILSENQIEIPVIQRDYAQGRINERVNQIRESFVNKLISVLLDDSQQELHLDFVYGRILGKDKAVIIARNKEAINNVLQAVQGYASNLLMDIKYDVLQKEHTNGHIVNTKLIPLDGQQRLTTLYLLHWYVLQRIDLPEKGDALKILNGFKYKTRKSTTEFCTFLSEMQPGVSELLFIPGKKVSIQIEKSTLFYRIWKNDPSVKGMLVMLDALHEKLQNETKETYQKLWKNLTENNKITFDFLDLDTLDQTDELYVKMNARGKQLSDFEHFKAWLQEERVNVSYPKWEEKLDTTWLDLFWKNKAVNVYDVDDNIYTFFKSVNLYAYVVKTEEDAIDKNLIERIRETNKEKNFIPLNAFKESNFFSPNSLFFLFKSFDSICDEKVNKLNESLASIFCSPFTNRKNLNTILVKDESSINYWERVYHYSFLLFINDVSNPFDADIIDKFKSWMRICRNLIYNTYIQTPDNFINAIKSVHELSKHKFTLEHELLHNDLKVNFFADQAKEEKKKLRYFSLGDNWKEKIIQYENHEYFYGQIDFMFNLLENEPENFDLFVKYGDKLSSLFESDIERDKFLLQRVLLSKGDYLIKGSGSKYSFCKSDKGNLRALNDNWRKVFDDPKRLSYLKSILDDERELTEIKDGHKEISWRYYFVKHPSAILYCSNRLIDFTDELNISLLKGTTFKGKHTDFYLYVLYQRLRKQAFTNLEIKHSDVNQSRRSDSYPSIKILDITNGKQTHILSINYTYTLSTNKKGFEISLEPFHHDTYKEIFSDFDKAESNVFFKVIERITEMEDVLSLIIKQVTTLHTTLK